MHYKNGREAKNGDKVLLIPSHGSPVVGILYDATAGNNFCNGKLALCAPNDLMPNLKECLHIDDVLAATKAQEEQKAIAVPALEPAAEPAVCETKVEGGTEYRPAAATV